jgi:hypothetical protein
MTHKKFGYNIRVEDNLIVADINKGLGVEGIRAFRQDLENLLVAKHSPKNMLVRMRDFKYPSESDMEEAVTFFREIPIKRIALSGAGPPRIRAAKSVLTTVGSSERFKIFRHEADAREWLAK